MSGFSGFPITEVADQAPSSETLDFLSNNHVSTASTSDPDYFFSAAARPDSPLTGDRLYIGSRWTLLFSGDLVDQDSIPFATFEEILESRNFSKFASFHGIWALAALDRNSRRLFLVTDRLGQHPLFSRNFRQGVGFSTELPSFCRLARPASFNEQWLYTCLYFQFPVGEITFLNEVARVPAATVIEHDIGTGRTSKHTYAQKFERASKLLEGQPALDHALDTFNEVLPQYAPPDSSWAMGFTAGWDARTVLAFLVDSDPVTYTYGIPGCADVEIAERAARQLHLRHRKILFDTDFEKQISSLIFDIVYLSGGLENCARSSLLYTYATITENDTTFPVTMSGIGLDSIFRGHLGPGLVSRSLAELFRGKPHTSCPDFLSPVIRDVPAFSRQVSGLIDMLRDQFGPLDDANTHLKYFIYETAPKFFAGEVNVARNFTTLRIPGLDQRIINLAFSISLSALSFSSFLGTHHRGGYDEQVLQAYLVSRASGGRMRYLPVYNIPPFAFTFGRSAYQATRPLFRAASRVRRFLSKQSIPAPLERYPHWFRTTAKEQVDALLCSEQSRISTLVNIPAPAELYNTNIHLLKVLLTAEIVMRLVENRWKRFW